MKQNEYISIHVVGRQGNENVSLNNYDISELRDMIDIVCGLMGHSSKSNDKVTLELQEGSVRQIYYSTPQKVAIASTLFGLILQSPRLEYVDAKIAKQIEIVQEKAIESGLIYQIGTSIDNKTLSISPDTNYRRLEAQWVDADYYLYGIVESAGGSTDGSIHLRTDNDLLNIEVDKSIIANLKENIIYHECGMYVKGRQNLATYEMDKSSLKLVSFVDYTSRYDEAYLQACIERATPVWSDIKDPALWLHEIRGYYEE